MFRKIRELFQNSSLLRGAFDYQLYAFAASLSLMSSILVGADFTNPNQLLDLVISNVLAFAIMYLMLLGFDYLFSRSRLTIGLVALALMGALLGFTKGFVTGLFMYLFGQQVDLTEAIGSRVWQTTFIGLWVVPLLALHGALRVRYRENRETLIGERVARVAADALAGNNLAEFVAGAKQKLENLRQSKQVADLESEVKTIVDEDLRPLSHKIWLSESQKFPSYRANDLMRIAIYHYVFQPQIVVPIWFVTALVPTVLFHGPITGLAIVISRTLCLLLVLLLALRSKARTLRLAWVKFAVAIVLVAASQTAVGYYLSGELNLPADFGYIVSNTIWLIHLTLLSGLGWAFFVADRSVEEELATLLGEQKLQASDWNKEYLLRNRQLAQFLHGHLQSQLVATAARLSQDGASSVEQKIRALEEILENAVTKFKEHPHSAMVNYWDELEANWVGVINLKIETIAVSDGSASQVYEVVNEGITNAIRHGFATDVKVLLQNHPLGYQVTVSDNGTGPRNGRPGLGSYYFDSVSPDWELVRGDAGAVLRVVLPR